MTYSWTTGGDLEICHNDLIAVGGYSEVHKMRRTNGQYFARKLVRRSRRVTKEDIENEARAVRKLCSRAAHDHIVEVYCHGWLSPKRETYFFDMEFCEETLTSYIDNNRTRFGTGPGILGVVSHVRVREAFQIAENITNGLKFIHDIGEVHRDLKPLNSRRHLPPPARTNLLILNAVLYGKNRQWKIADFGISSELTKGRPAKTEGGRGTRGYRAPEILMASEYDYKADIWALGCVIYEIFTYTRVFEDFQRVGFEYRALPAIKLRGEVFSCLGQPLSAMLSPNQSDRPTAKFLLQFLQDPKPNSIPHLRSNELCEECRIRKRQCHFVHREQPCDFCYEHDLPPRSCIKAAGGITGTRMEEQINVRKITEHYLYLRSKYPTASTGDCLEQANSFSTTK